MAELSTEPIGTCLHGRRLPSYRRVNGLVLCAPCGRREKRRLGITIGRKD